MGGTTILGIGTDFRFALDVGCVLRMKRSPAVFIRDLGFPFKHKALVDHHRRDEYSQRCARLIGKQFPCLFRWIRSKYLLLVDVPCQMVERMNGQKMSGDSNELPVIHTISR